jgi:hypothetical protein
MAFIIFYWAVLISNMANKSGVRETGESRMTLKCQAEVADEVGNTTQLRWKKM